MIGIISDIHGNYPALRAVLEELDRIGCKRIISLGDVCGYYCMINECIEELIDRKVINILGNHDYYMINNESCGRSYTANICLDYQRKIISPQNLEWLKLSVHSLKMDNMWMVHGGWNDYLDEYISDFTFLDKRDLSTNIYISGHTHIQRQVNGKEAVYVNPGSVGQPRDGIEMAAYAVIFDDGNIELKRIGYNINEIVKKMHEAGFQERVYTCLYSGVKIGEDGK